MNLHNILSQSLYTVDAEEKSLESKVFREKSEELRINHPQQLELIYWIMATQKLIINGNKIEWFHFWKFTDADHSIGKLEWVVMYGGRAFATSLHTNQSLVAVINNLLIFCNRRTKQKSYFNKKKNRNIEPDIPLYIYD